MRTILKRLAILPILALILFSCKNSDIVLKPSISGKAGEVIIVTNKGHWEAEPGSMLRTILASDYPYLPQREPSFNLINIGERDFTTIFQIHRNILMLKIDPQYTKPKMVTKEDIWAAPQTVITITAPSEEAATKFLDKQKGLLFNTINQAERNRVIKNSRRYEAKAIRTAVTREFGGSPYFPKGYSIKKDSDNFIWISYETTYTNQGIFIYKIPYVDSTSLELSNILTVQNNILEQNVPGMIENSYMTINMSAEQYPHLEWLKYRNRDLGEIRGFWEVQNDFMGGPFISHVFYDKSGENIIVIQGFVYAPRFDKRNYLRQVESIMYSFEWEENFNK